jgi:hypothetical protein
MSHNVFPVVSNIAFLLPSLNAFVYGEYIYSVIYALILFTSGSFHACDEGFGCVFPFVVETNMDYIVAILIIPMTAIYFVHWHYFWQPMQNVLLVLFVFLVILVQIENTSDSLTAPALIVAASIAIPLCYWIGYFVYMRWVYVPPPPPGKHSKRTFIGAGGDVDLPNPIPEPAAPPRVRVKVGNSPKSAPKAPPPAGPWRPSWRNWGYFPKYEWGALLASIGLSAIAIALFATQGMFAYQWVPDIHAMWHIFAAFGQYFLMEIKAPRKGSVGYYRARHQTWQKIRAMGGLRALYDKADQIDVTKPLEFIVV